MIYPLIKLMQLLIVFILNHTINFNLSCKNASNLSSSEKYSEKIFQLLNTLARFLFTALLCYHLIVKQWQFL